MANLWEQIREGRDRDFPEDLRVPTVTDRDVIDETEGIQASESHGAKMEGKVGKDAVKVIENWLTKEKHEPLERTLTAHDLVDGPKETQRRNLTGRQTIRAWMNLRTRRGRR